MVKRIQALVLAALVFAGQLGAARHLAEHDHEPDHALCAVCKLASEIEEELLEPPAPRVLAGVLVQEAFIRSPYTAPTLTPPARAPPSRAPPPPHS